MQLHNERQIKFQMDATGSYLAISGARRGAVHVGVFGVVFLLLVGLWLMFLTWPPAFFLGVLSWVLALLIALWLYGIATRYQLISLNKNRLTTRDGKIVPVTGPVPICIDQRGSQYGPVERGWIVFIDTAQHGPLLLFDGLYEREAVILARILATIFAPTGPVSPPVCA